MEIKNKITKNELEEIFEISKEQFKGESWTYEQFESSYNSPSSIFIVSKEKGKIVSFLLAMDLIDSINLLLIATKEENKSCGHSKCLIETLKKLNRKIWLEVKESNLPAQNLYAKCGFEKKYVRKKYYSNGEKALIFEFENC